jgi:CBS domain-containing protein
VAHSPLIALGDRILGALIGAGEGWSVAAELNGTPYPALRVEALMTRSAVTCGPDATLEEAARLMWERDCGALPVTNGLEGRRVIGMITDRDVCMAALLQGRPLGELRVRDAMARTVHSCRPGDSVERALRVMAEARVRRLPVVDGEDQILGVLSLADAVRAAGGAWASGEAEPRLAQVLRAICAPAAAGGEPASKGASE